MLRFSGPGQSVEEVFYAQNIKYRVRVAGLETALVKVSRGAWIMAIAEQPQGVGGTLLGMEDLLVYRAMFFLASACRVFVVAQIF